MSEARFPGRILYRFVEAANVELGPDQFGAILALSELPAGWGKPATFRKTGQVESARAYAVLQAAMRTYYGRGARGTLLRVGQRLWHHLLEDATLPGKAQAVVIRRLPLRGRRKSTLELLSRFLSARPGDVTLHTLDLDLLLADHVSPTTQEIQSRQPVCFVTQGLIHESLLWATGQRPDVEETSCRARGDNTCEFRITLEK
jgi:predicted hydrocarbon binding protein